MLTWAICWMVVKSSKEFDELQMMLFVSIVADILLFGFCGWAIFK